MNQSTEISKFKGQVIIDRLQSGVPSPSVIDILTVGRKDIIDRVYGDLEHIKNHSCDSLIIEGQYGFGKTHIIEYIAHQALNQNFAVSTVTLDARETPFNKFDIIYKQIVNSLKMPDAPYSNGLEILLDKWCELSSNDSNNEIVPDYAPNRLKHSLLAYIVAKDTSCKYNLRRVISGEPLPVQFLKNVFNDVGYNEYNSSLSIKSHEEYINALKTIQHIIQQCGYSGHVIVFDESEAIFLNRIDLRLKAYKVFDYFLTCKNGMIKLYCVFAFTPDFFEILKKDRTAFNSGKYPEMVEIFNNFSQHTNKKYILKELYHRDIFETLKKIRQIHYSAFEWNAYEVVTDEILQKILRKLEDQSIRTIIKATVEILDLAEQYPDFDPLTEIELFR